MGYVPLDSGFLRSTVLGHGPTVVASWAIILASADKLGETDINPMTIASLLRISDAEAKQAWSVLTEPDADSHNKQFEGRRLIPVGEGKWRLVSYDKYQAKASRAAAAARQAAFAARKKTRDSIAEAGGVDTADAFK